MVVNVDATTAVLTSFAPSLAATKVDLPISRCLAIFSKTTIELSTNIPIPNAIPPKDMILRLTPLPYIRLNVAITDTGMEIEIIKVIQILRRNRYSTKMASKPPMIPAFRTSFTAEAIKID